MGLFSLSSFAAEDSSSNWYSEKDNVTADEKLYLEKASQEFVIVEEHLAELRRQKTFRQLENQNTLQEIEKEKSFAEGRLKILKSASEAERAHAQQEFEKSLSHFNQGMEKTSKNMLSEDHYFLWQLRSQMRDREYQEKQIHKIKPDPSWGNKEKLDQKLKAAIGKRKTLDEKIKAYEKSKGKARDEARQALEEEMKSLNKEYKEILSRSKRSQGPVIKTIQ
ncbi:MAG: hypothetical protein HYZ85_01425 [Candidatus Omnitrophica bacterium]|nr:hypothetical protein [Candidatus Omnitrophota bacterium]